MSLQTRKELLKRVQKKYNNASWYEKGKLLNELIALTGYRRKYAINLLNRTAEDIATQKNNQRLNKRKYDESVRQALLTIWYAANQICSKRLAPFIPELLSALERFGHLSLPVNVRDRLLDISAATIDRLLESERCEHKKGMSTTRPGSLLKKQIKIRTFSDWNDVAPGFLEGDLVAHCGDRVDGSFLNTLVLTDIASTWTEFFPLLRKSEDDVISAIKVAQLLLPFLLLGLDTDNGCEFINYALLEFCKLHKITFTRARAYKKNDQAHVEEKNGSIVRRLVGYDRYEGLDAYNALSELYAVLRLYVNFFQPSLKLISKKREGAKVSKKYDTAKTPYQRLLLSEHISEEEKTKLTKQYNDLDPLLLLKNLEKLQNNFWQYAWKASIIHTIPNETSSRALPNDATINPVIKNVKKNNLIFDSKGKDENSVIKDNKICQDTTQHQSCAKSPECADDNQIGIRRYRYTKKPKKQRGPITWRTRKDPFENVWNKLRMQLELNPERTAKSLLNDLTLAQPDQFNIKLLRTLQRRVANWRMEQIKLNQEMNQQNRLIQYGSVETYVSLVAHAITNG